SFFFTLPPLTNSYTLSLHDALPISGRHFNFRLHPLTLKELNQKKPASLLQGNFTKLLDCGGFPEPFFSSEPYFYERWRRSHLDRSEEHTSELQSRVDLVCRLLLEKK